MAIMNDQLVQKIRACPSLPTLPAIAVQVLELAQHPEIDLAEIAKTISKDPALSSKILRTVNSSFYGRSQAVSTVSHALVIMGLQSVKTLVLGFSLVSNLSKNKSNGFKHIYYWKRSIYAATAARVLAQKFGIVQQEEAFLAALLKDIGMLVLDQVLGESYGALFARADHHTHLAQLEQAELGLTHADVGGILAEQWKLPPVLACPIAYHHNTTAVSDPQVRRLTEVVSMAGRSADVFADEQPAQAIIEVRNWGRTIAGLSDADCDALLDEIGKKTREVAKLFEINIGSGAEYDAILKKANETLIEITLQSQQQAQQLQLQNQQLQHAANTDALTGLANRGRFDAFLLAGFNAAKTSGQPISVLLMDVDKFKSINDKHGHPTGDAVLKHLGKLLGGAARRQDLAARYGGEEMCLILPNTPRATAAAVAETIRRTIAARPVKAGNLVVPITASIGVATWEPGCPLQTTQHLVKAADLAVYHAKKSGRNCVKVFALPGAKAA
jgi:diguanylate cyclase (GGDEF)-like protein